MLQKEKSGMSDCLYAKKHQYWNGIFMHLRFHLLYSSINSSDYVFVTPVEVDSNGGYLTHDVTRRSHRSRRSLSSSVHYRLSAFGQDMHLDLHPSSMVGPGFTVQSFGPNGITTLMEDDRFYSCLYQGFIRNLSSSLAAISTCSGLVSICQYLLTFVY